MSETNGSRRRGKSAVRWKNRVKEYYIHESVPDRWKGIEQARIIKDYKQQQTYRFLLGYLI